MLAIYGLERLVSSFAWWFSFAALGWTLLGAGVTLFELSLPWWGHAWAALIHLAKDIPFALLCLAFGWPTCCTIASAETLVHYKALWRQVFEFVRDWLYRIEDRYDREPGPL